MREASRFKDIRGRIAGCLEKQGEDPSPERLTRLAIEEVLAGFSHAEDPLREALAHWADMPEGAVSYTPWGYEINVATIHEAVREAKKMSRKKQTVTLPLPMFYSQLPASAGVIHGEVAREFWGLIREKYRIDWSALVAEAWDEVTRKITLHPKLAMARASPQLKARVLRRAWTKLREGLGAYNLSITDVQKEAWAAVLGVPVETPVRPAAPKRPKKVEARRGRRPRVTVRVTPPAPTAPTIETPYGKFPAMYTLSPTEVRAFVSLAKGTTAWLKKEDLEFAVLGASRHASLSLGLGRGWLPLRAGDEVFKFSPRAFELLAKAKFPVQVGAATIGEREVIVQAIRGLEKVVRPPEYALIIGYPRGHYLFRQVELEDAKSYPKLGLPLDQMIAAIRGNLGPMKAWAKAMLGEEVAEITTKKVKKTTRGWNVVYPEYADRPLDDIKRVEATTGFSSDEGWGNYVVIPSDASRSGKVAILAYPSAEMRRKDAGFVTGAGYALPWDNAKQLAGFMWQHYAEFARRYARGVAERGITTRKELENFHESITKWPEFREIETFLIACRGIKEWPTAEAPTVGATAFQKMMDKSRQAARKEIEVSATVPQRRGARVREGRGWVGVTKTSAQEALAAAPRYARLGPDRIYGMGAVVIRGTGTPHVYYTTLKWSKLYYTFDLGETWGKTKEEAVRQAGLLPKG